MLIKKEVKYDYHKYFVMAAAKYSRMCKMFFGITSLP